MHHLRVRDVDDHAYAALQDIIKSNYDGAILALDDMSEERCFFDIYEQFNALKIPVISMGNKTKLFSACCTAWVDARRGEPSPPDMFHLMGCDEVLLCFPAPVPPSTSGIRTDLPPPSRATA